jgi:hypothetical protein
MRSSKLYKKWRTMTYRCVYQSNRGYPNYGGRGIKICEEWKEFIPFMEWAVVNGYKEGLTIDRINNDGNYCPENCRWATRHEQDRNTRRTRLFTWNGETKCFFDWANDERCEVSYSCLWRRVNESGWDFEKAFTTPPQNQG